MTEKTALISLHGRKFGITAEGDIIAPKRHGVAVTTVTSAQLLALNATPQTIIAAPGPNLAIVPKLVAVKKAAGTAYTAGAGEDLVLKYTNGAGDECSAQFDSDGFLDQTTEQVRVGGGPVATDSVSTMAPVANAAVVLHLLVGEVTGGTGDLTVRVKYDIIPTDF